MANLELTNLIKRRNSLDVRLKRFQSYLKELENVTVADNEVTEITQRLSVIENVFSAFNDIQSDIEVSTEDIESEFTFREDFENRYFNSTSWAKVIIETFNNNADAGSVASGASQRSHVSSSARAPEVNNENLVQLSTGTALRLPTIDLPKFNGSFDDWLEFKYKFKSLIHDNETINNIQKLHYLRASLVGAASDVVNSLDFTADDYCVAWDILCKRFDNTKKLMHKHLDGLFNLELIGKKSAESLRKLSDNISKHIKCLNRLGLPADSWDVPIIHFLSSKFDTSTITEWEEYHSKVDIPTLELFIDFLKHKADLLDTIEDKLAIRNKRGGVPVKFKHASRSLVAKNYSCFYCTGDHLVFNCKDFIKLSVEERLASVKQNKVCINCLHSGHNARDCKYGSCKKCKQKHNTLLHSSNQDSAAALSSVSFHSVNVMLPTAMVTVYGKGGLSQNVVALLDSGSQTSFITSSLCERLHLPLKNQQLSVIGLGNNYCKIQQNCNVSIESLNGNFRIEISCFVLPEITGSMPGFAVDPSKLNIPHKLRLANPDFYSSRDIDILIGSDAFWQLLCIGQINLGKGLPTLQKTKLGWIVTGAIPCSSPTAHSCLSYESEIHEQISKFWAVEELPNRCSLSPEEEACERHFVETHHRHADGRFIVSIPLKEDPKCLGESFHVAKGRLFSLEKKFKLNSSFHERYREFLNEYEELGHMSKVIAHNEQQCTYYMPHHGVFKEDSSTTKLRVVFNASQETSTGKSFNSIQMVGPVVQQDLLSILLRFRTYLVVISADIEKMYRQVLVEPSQRSLQRILWRSNPDQTIENYEMNTVTYGTASASYLATRCLKQISLELHGENPLISKIIGSDFYVDDLLTGCDSFEDAKLICKHVHDALAAGGFRLRKFISNFPEVLSSVSTDCRNSNDFLIIEEDTTKTLGLMWSSSSDSLMYKIRAYSSSSRFTKRTLLSYISQIFDPLGLLGPSIVIAKIMMQRIWLLKLSWDESLPMDLHNEWQMFVKDLSSFNDLQISRRVSCQNPVRIELHGFADASEGAYGACIYLRSIGSTGNVQVHLLCAKSRVAPLKSLTIPRLELCAALLLSQVAFQVLQALSISFDTCFFWSDSTIVLEWMKTPPHLLQTFVRNRVCTIHDNLPSHRWRHVSSSDNPADLLSRGLKPSLLLTSDHWWHGPGWLSQDQVHWPVSTWHSPSNLPELKPSSTLFIYVPNHDFPFDKFSSFSRMKHVASYVLRFISNCKRLKSDRNIGPLSAPELQAGLLLILKFSQWESFPQEIRDLAANKFISKKSKLFSLTPFVDSDGILRVGGRLANSNFSFEKKHPAVISSKHVFARLLMQYEHRKLMHIGPQGLLASVRDSYWPIGGRNFSKLIVRNCVRCARFRERTSQPIMGNLPQSRTEISFPFHTTGVDYAGPFQIKLKEGRVKIHAKAWICLFVCFNTKALHLELVSDLTSKVFIMALKRFTSRRGFPKNIYSDNGTTFVGAQREISEIYDFLAKNNDELSQTLGDQGIAWHFIPAQSPHFGGLWEAGVKSVKHHIKRVVGSSILTYEEFYSLLVQIEAILNSRPLTPLSTEPQDLDPLTPAHFLVGRKLMVIPEVDYRSVPENRLKRFQHLQRMSQHFWERWSKEYISELQVRTKWATHEGELKPDTLVLVKEPNQPPLYWRLGRIISTFPGGDGISRVADVRTSSGIIRRAFSKICPLPIDQEAADPQADCMLETERERRRRVGTFGPNCQPWSRSCEQ